MSAFLSVGDEREIAILTDGAAYTDDGTVRWIGRKITTGKIAPIAVTTRGNHVIGRYTATWLCRQADQRGVDDALEIFRTAFADFKLRPELKGLDKTHWHIAAFSPTLGPIRLSGHNMATAFADGEDPGALMEVTGTYTAGNKVSAEAYAAHGLTPRRNGESIIEFMRRVGPSIMEAWRRSPATLMPEDESEEPQYLIGGQCDLTTVTRNGVHTETLRTWPDQIGKKIDPFASDVATKGAKQHRELVAA